MSKVMRSAARWGEQLLAVALAAPGPGASGDDAVSRRRCLYRAEGFSSFRKTWWDSIANESYFDVIRQLWLMEQADALALEKRAATEERRALVIQLGHFGDLLHTMPLVKRLGADYATDILVGPWCESVARHYGFAASVIPYAPRVKIYNRGDTSRCLGLSAEVEFLRSLRSRGYELVIDAGLVANIPDAVLMRAAGCGTIIGPRPDDELYPPRVKWLVPQYDPARYEAERIAALADLVGVRGGQPVLTFPVTDAARAEVRAIAGLAPGFAVLIPGAGWDGKRWPHARFAELGQWMERELKLQVVLAGSKDEAELCSHVSSGISSNSVLNLAGKTTWAQLAALLEGARICVTNDCGPMHLAAAVGTPTVSMFGPTEVSRWAPRGPMHRVIRKVKSCPDCRPWHVEEKCRHDGACMKAIGVEDVKAAIMESLGAERS